MSDGVKDGNEVERRTLEVTPAQAQLLQQASREVQSAQSEFQALSRGILAGFEDLPDEYRLATISDDPPELMIEYTEPTETDD